MDKHFLNQAIAKDEDIMLDIQEMNTILHPGQHLSRLRLVLEEYRWLVEREIAPVLRYDYWSHMTIYDVTFSY